MADTLRTCEFSAELLGAVQHFDCGDRPWEREVAEWIKGRPVGDSVIEAMAKTPATRVWLYLSEDGSVVGFGSLGETTWRWPDSKRSPRVRVGVIPMLGLDRLFQGKPDGAGSGKYSYQILGDLLLKAREAGYALLGLFVHRDNAKAKALYLKAGFAEFPPGFGDNVRMLIAVETT
jgi:hypothetical protein